MKQGPAADLKRAIETFVAGWTRVRGITHPCRAARVDGLWLVRDGPGHPRNRRNEEWIACGLPPALVDRIARRNAQGRFKVSVIRGPLEPEEPLRVAYRALGYRLLGTEGFFVHPLRRIAAATTPVDIVRVTTTELAELVARAARRRQLLPEHLGDSSPTIRLYAAMGGPKVVGWVSSVTAGEAAWCANLFVHAAWRRKGIGRALMTRMLREDRAGGFTASVLLASHAGALLYPGLGYQRIGELMLYGPRPARFP